MVKLISSGPVSIEEKPFQIHAVDRIREFFNCLAPISNQGIPMALASYYGAL